jgi:predicted TIM-barrel fold metal-dependent hydrolase
MAIIDPHHHLWDLEAVSYPWLAVDDKTGFFGSYAALARNYLAEDYLRDASNQDLQKSVHLQAEADHADPVAETRWLTSQEGPIPTAFVVYADFRNNNIESILSQQCEFPQVRGIRQILNHHPDPALSYLDEDLLQNDTWLRNFSLLSNYGLSFDMQLYYQQMGNATRLAGQHGSTQFIVNHTGMPVERDEAGIAGWREGMRQLATCENVAVKISGLGMTDPDWSAETIRPIVLDTIEMFGVGRCMFASNFPVDSLFSDYDTLYDAYRSITAAFSSDEQAMLFHGNAARIYRI